MDKFEDIGRRFDEEIARLRNYIEDEVAPETERRTAEFLREVSVKITEVAAKLEAPHGVASSSRRRRFPS